MHFIASDIANTRSNPQSYSYLYYSCLKKKKNLYTHYSSFTCSVLHVLDYLTSCLYLFWFYASSNFLHLSQQVSKKALHGDNLEDDWPPNPFDGGPYGTKLKANDLLNIPEADCSAKFIKEQGYFKRFERDGTLDWSFHSDYINCALLNDYQRLVPRNYVSSVLMHE